MEENKQLIEPKGSIIEQYVDWWKNGENYLGTMLSL